MDPSFATKLASDEANGPVDDVEEDEEHREGSDEDVVVEGQLMAVPVVLREMLVLMILLEVRDIMFIEAYF